MTGFGRTGKMFACEHWNVVPDIMTVSKSISNGSVPLGATIVTKEVASKFEGGKEAILRHSYTFEGHPVACAAGLVALDIMEKENVVKNSRNMGKYLYDSLQALRRHRIVGEVRGGLGLDCSFELLRDNETKEPLTAEEKSRIFGMLKTKLRQVGLWGGVSNPFQLKPPLVITKDEVDEILRGLDKVIGEVEKEFFLS